MDGGMDVGERWEYSRRLMTRLNTRIVEGAPEGVGLSDILISDEMVPANQALEEALRGWEAGEVGKEELDQKAAGYLKHWREVMTT